MPFITRYRRDQTGGLDEEQIGRIRDSVTKLRLLDERKQTILRSIESQHALTDELREQIERADSVKRLEDLYLPYRPKKQTLATKAREQGLGPLAEEILTQDKACRRSRCPGGRLRQHRQGRARCGHAPCSAPGHILAEQFSEDPDVAPEGPQALSQDGQAGQREDSKTTRRRISSSTTTSISASRCTAFRRTACWRSIAASGPRCCACRVEADRAAIEQLGIELLVPPEHAHKDFLTGCVRDALARLMLPSLEREARRELTEKAETHAVEVFARNLRNLLLQPPLPGKTRAGGRSRLQERLQAGGAR